MDHNKKTGERTVKERLQDMAFSIGAAIVAVYFANRWTRGA